MTKIDWDTQAQCAKCREVFGREDEHVCGKCAECTVGLKLSEDGAFLTGDINEDNMLYRFDYCPICGNAIAWA